MLETERVIDVNIAAISELELMRDILNEVSCVRYGYPFPLDSMKMAEKMAEKVQVTINS